MSTTESCSDVGLVLEAASKQKILMPRPRSCLHRYFIGLPRPQKNCLCLGLALVDMVNGNHIKPWFLLWVSLLKPLMMLAHGRRTIPERAWLGNVNHLYFGGHQPYLWNGWSSQGRQLRWMVNVVNWWPSSVTVYHTYRRHLFTSRRERGTASHGSVNGSRDFCFSYSYYNITLCHTLFPVRHQNSVHTTSTATSIHADRPQVTYRLMKSNRSIKWPHVHTGQCLASELLYLREHVIPAVMRILAGKIQHSIGARKEMKQKCKQWSVLNITVTRRLCNDATGLHWLFYTNTPDFLNRKLLHSLAFSRHNKAIVDMASAQHATVLG